MNLMISFTFSNNRVCPYLHSLVTSTKLELPDGLKVLQRRKKLHKEWMLIYYSLISFVFLRPFQVNS